MFLQMNEIHLAFQGKLLTIFGANNKIYKVSK